MVDDDLERTATEGPIDCVKLVENNEDLIFEQDYATSHGTKKNHQFMVDHFPDFTPTLYSKQEGFENVFGSKFDDFWWIERIWAILAKDVYRNPAPKTINAVIKRLRKAVKNFDQKTLVKLVHQSHARMMQIWKNKGKKIRPNWKSKDTPWHCKCQICNED